nr:helix-turn-helix domain-containing protein [Lentilactobacillus kisonensis]
MENVKLIKYIEEYDPVSDKNVTYKQITLTERVKITKTSFTNSHTYLIQADKDINDRANYIVPFDDPDINLRSDYQIYRRINGFLQPSEIKASRRRLGLSLRELAAILGMSFSTLSEIENGLVLHSQIQDNLLRLLAHGDLLQQLAVYHKNYVISHFDSKTFESIMKKLKHTEILKLQG